jgi:hypothetical protein
VDQIIKMGMVGIPLIDLTLLHFIVCPNPRPRFSSAYVMVFFMEEIIPGMYGAVIDVTK